MAASAGAQRRRSGALAQVLRRLPVGRPPDARHRAHEGTALPARNRSCGRTFALGAHSARVHLRAMFKRPQFVPFSTTPPRGRLSGYGLCNLCLLSCLHVQGGDLRVAIHNDATARKLSWYGLGPQHRAGRRAGHRLPAQPQGHPPGHQVQEHPPGRGGPLPLHERGCCCETVIRTASNHPRPGAARSGTLQPEEPATRGSRHAP